MIASLVMTPIAKKIAYKVGAIDIPKDDRRVHKTPIPRMGGIAIYLGFVISMMISLPIEKKMMGMLAGATLIVIIGIIDDMRPLSAKVKLMGQVLSACILVYCGIRIGGFTIPFTDKSIDLSILSIPVTIFWIVGITNTLNLIDGLDGLAAGVSTIAAFSLSYVAYANDRPEAVIFITLAIAGSSLGFLPYNFNPAKIFMGDTGSLFLGYMLAAISIEGTMKGATAIVTIVPVLALGLPIFDTTFAILRRIANGRPIMEPDKGHLHHRLLSTGMGQKRTVLTLYAISTIFGLSAALVSNSKSLYFVVTILLISAIMYLGVNSKKSLRQKNK
ncbi:undecaprenyl/decaprenyl-phosphate alpha-N-acetylglucosaminyl 1-phosphate transferase [Lutibacter sp. B2]|nr:undecaprenyl/decaprenyl-phosphate alpha-N-acetylglucosaminyl 1-phosphate transferase [Lutibacter sp. B2]